MVSYVIEQGIITQTHLKLLEWVKEELKGMTNSQSCHDYCQELASKNKDLIWRKGKFNGHDHSWLICAENTDILIDACPWASGSGPILLTLASLSPWKSLYKENEPFITAFKKINNLKIGTKIKTLDTDRVFMVVSYFQSEDKYLMEKGNIYAIDRVIKSQNSSWDKMFEIVESDNPAKPRS